MKNPFKGLFSSTKQPKKSIEEMFAISDKDCSECTMGILCTRVIEDQYDENHRCKHKKPGKPITFVEYMKTDEYKKQFGGKNELLSK